jgi:hypothetical protein
MNARLLALCTVAAWLPGMAAVPAGSPKETPAAAPLDDLPLNCWVLRSPRADTPPSPRLGYEGACVWDSKHRVMIRYGGHNQGGGGEQGSEIWTFDLVSARWTLMLPNTSPPGICCGQQNLFDPLSGRYIRFPAFSGSHGWQWFREIYLNDATVWTYDLAENTWRNRRPVPAPRVSPLRCASWDSEFQVCVLFGGEGNSEGTLVYDPYTNTWTRMQPAVQPAFRSGGNMVYDPHHRCHVLFGAQFTDDPHTWLYDLRRNEWTDAAPPEMPPTNRNDAVLCYDSVARRVVALVKVTEGEGDDATHHLQTWTYDVAANRWTRQNPQREPDPSGNRARQLMFAPEFNVAVLENRTRGLQSGEPEQQVWLYRLAETPPAEELPPPVGLQCTTQADAVQLRWQAASGTAAGTSYIVYRGQAAKPWEAQLHEVARTAPGATTFVDRQVQPGTVYHYALRAVDPRGATGPRSIVVRSQPPVVDDGSVSVLGPQRVELSWTPPPGDDLLGYHVERAVVEVYTEDQLVRLKSQTPPLEEPSMGAIRRIGPFERLTAQPVPEPKFVDESLDLRQPQSVAGQPSYERTFSRESLDESGRAYRYAVYAYRVRAVNRLGVESGPSPAWLSIPAAPQHVFSREEGTTCHLRWAASAAPGVRGYRVYRMDGRFNSAAIARLTPEPITATEFSDAEAGRGTRRYYVVAVDALGQEGFPSAPVWFNREWQRFYEPFVGPWHQ